MRRRSNKVKNFFCFLILGIGFVAISCLILFALPVDQKMLCEKSKNQCTFFSKTIVDFGHSPDFVSLSDIQNAGVKKIIDESSSKTYTRYDVYLNTTYGELDTFLSYYNKQRAISVQKSFNNYLNSRDEKFEIEKNQNSSGLIFVGILFFMVGLVMLAVSAFELLSVISKIADKIKRNEPISFKIFD